MGDVPANAVIIAPADVADPAFASGGNTYDRRIAEVAGLPLVTVADDGELATRLAALPDGSSVLLDGLVACGAPDIVVPHASRLRLVVLVHLPLADETGLDPAVAADLDRRERTTLHAAAAVVATSAWAGRRLVEHHGLPTERVHVVPPGVDPAPLTGQGDGGRLLCVGSVTPRKGQDLLASALAGLRDVAWTCACVGSVLRNPGFVAGLRPPDRMTLVGPVSDADLAARYAAADLVVLPSRGETYGMVVTEALARSIPVLATAVDALPDTVGTSGMLVPPEDPAALRAALRAWLTDGDLRARLVTAAWDRRARLTDWAAPARQLTALLTGEPSWSR